MLPWIDLTEITPPGTIGGTQKIGFFKSDVLCDWPLFCGQLLRQWPRLTTPNLDKTKHNRHKIALLIGQEYSINLEMIEHYLRNYERTAPLH